LDSCRKCIKGFYVLYISEKEKSFAINLMQIVDDSGKTKYIMRNNWAANTLSLQVRFRSKQRNPGFPFYRCRNATAPKDY